MRGHPGPSIHRETFPAREVDHLDRAGYAYQHLNAFSDYQTSSPLGSHKSASGSVHYAPGPLGKDRAAGGPALLTAKPSRRSNPHTPDLLSSPRPSLVFKVPTCKPP